MCYSHKAACTSSFSRRPLIVSWCLGVLVVVFCRSLPAAEIDRVLAAVNGKVIAESDLRMARNLNTLLMFGQNPAGAEPSREKEMSRLIDLELIRQELESFPLGTQEQAAIDARVEELKGGYAEIGGIELIMRRLGLQAAELQSYLRLQASIMRFVDVRFRPFVIVAPEEVQAYYRDRLVPSLQQEKASIPPVEKVSADIENILREEKVNTALDDWIKEIRSHSRIEYFTEVQLPSAPEHGGTGRGR